MTHEFRDIIDQAITNQQKGLKNVLATVVDLDGTSYRKPGVRMLFSEEGQQTGAISGGCIEKEVFQRAQSVFKDGKAKVITYDGRYRLGCEGLLYILIEPFHVGQELANAFEEQLEKRQSFDITSYYQKQDDSTGNYGSVVQFGEGNIAFSDHFNPKQLEDVKSFTQNLSPLTQLIIIGAEHDAAKLANMASPLGWQISMVHSPKTVRKKEDFPGVHKMISASPETLTLDHIDEQTAIMIMTHNYALDLNYLLKLTDKDPFYIGVLGSRKRNKNLQNDLFTYAPDLDMQFLDKIHSPAGLNLGAITPEEIALSILSEILSSKRNTETTSLSKINTTANNA